MIVDGNFFNKSLLEELNHRLYNCIARPDKYNDYCKPQTSIIFSINIIKL